MIFVTSDLHFNHKNVCKYNNRPYDNVEEMNENIIDNWNKQVNPQDTIYVLGDFCFSNNFDDILKRLKGEVILIHGNHDNRKLKNSTYAHAYYINYSFKHQGYAFFLSHYAHRVWCKSHYGSINLFGHSHGNLQTYNLSFDCGIDTNPNYMLYSLDEDIIPWVQSRTQEMKENGRIIERDDKIFYQQDDVEYFKRKYEEKNND